MKRILIVILFVLYFYMPREIYALNLSNVSVEYPDRVNIGDKFEVSIAADIEDISKSTEGVLALEYEIDFDDKVLDLEKVDAKGFDTKVGYSTKYFMLVSSVIPDSSTKCNDNLLSCNKKFKATLTFYVKSVDYTSTKIKLLNMNVASFKVDANHNYNENNMIMTKFDYDKSGTVKINKDKSIRDVAPGVSIVDIYNTPVIDNVLINDVLGRKKEDYNYKDKEVIDDELDREKYYIKNIKIDNYYIKFNKDTYKYNLVLPNDVNELDIKVDTNSSKVKYNISGANDLKGNNDVVYISVNNGTNYVISVMRDVIKERDYPNSPSLKKPYKEVMAVGIVVLLICAIIIKIKFTKVNDNKKDNSNKNI